MLEKFNYKFWRMPWGYSQCAAVMALLLLCGGVLQLLVGPMDFGWLSFPVNAILAAILMLLSIFLGIFSENKRVRWLSDVPWSVSLIIVLALCALLMGIVPQENDSRSFFGLDTVTRNWTFMLTYGALLLSLGTLIVRRLKTFCWRNWAFYANHIGLWLFLAAAGLGAADEKHYVMYVPEKETIWHGRDDRGYIHKLPLAIHLNDFDIDEYPSKRVIVDRRTGEVQSFAILPADSARYCWTMLPPEPRAFLSDMELYTEDGDTLKSVLEVNDPMQYGSWTIYQYGYDTLAGRKSSYSIFLLVYDPWQIFVYGGILLMALGSVSMLFMGKKKGGTE